MNTYDFRGIDTGVCSVFASKIVGKICVSHSDGEKFHDFLKTRFRDAHTVFVSLKGVEHLTAAFIHSAFCDFLDYFTRKELESKLQFEDISDDDRLYINSCMDERERYNKDPEAYKKTMQDIEDEVFDDFWDE